MFLVSSWSLVAGIIGWNGWRPKAADVGGEMVQFIATINLVKDHRSPPKAKGYGGWQKVVVAGL
jgi:hypothetical protein